MTLHIFLMLIIMASVVIFLRFFPFIVFSGGRKVPPIVEYLGTTVTAAAIAMLVIYSFYGSLEYSLEGFSRFLPAAAASILTVHRIQALFAPRRVLVMLVHAKL